MKGLQVTFRGKTIRIAPEFKENILVYKNRCFRQKRGSGRV